MIQVLSNKSTSFSGEISIGGSKSISNRMLIIRELSGSNCMIKNLSTSDDTILLDTYLKRITTCQRSGIPMIIDVKNAGTVARFLTAYLIFHEGKWLITGAERMKKRPMQGIIDGVRQIGGIVNCHGENGFLPIQIIGSDISGGKVKIDVTKSSQFLSALMLIAPCLEKGIDIEFNSNPVSASYIDMTSKLIQKYGGHVNISNDGIKVLPGKYEFHQSTVEADWSSVSYWYEAVALSENAEVSLPGLWKNSLQGDSVIADIYENFGVSTVYSNNGIVIKKEKTAAKQFIFDFQKTPDIVPTIMTTCAALNIEGEFINIQHLEYKESNRIESLKTELNKIGAEISKSGSSYLLKTKPVQSKSLTFTTHNDHRLAMCLAPLVLKYDTVNIENPDVVNKSYPEFWGDFKKLNFANFKSLTN